MSTETLTDPVTDPFPISDQPESWEVALNRLAVATGVDEAPEAPKHARVSTDVIQGSPATIMEVPTQRPLIEDADERLVTPDELEELETTDAKPENLKEHRARDLGRRALLVVGIIRTVGLKTYVADAARTKVENGVQKITNGYQNTVNKVGDNLLDSMRSLDEKRASIRKRKEAADRLVALKAQSIIDRTAERRARKQ